MKRSQRVQKQITEALQQYPDRELLFLYPNEYDDDYQYTVGYPANVLIDEYAIDGDRIWLRDSDYDEMFEHVADNIALEYFTMKDFPLSDEQVKWVDDKAKDYIEGLEWKKAIIVMIHS